METLKIISQAGLAILFINVILYFIGFFKNDKAYKYFSMYLVSIFCIQLVMNIFAARSLNNHFLSTYYLFFQFTLLSIFFYNLFLPVAKAKSRAVLFISGAVVTGLIAQYSLEPATYFTFNSLGFLLTSIILIAYSVLYLYELLSRRLFFHYVTVGIFIYLISSALIFASAASLVTINDDLYIYIWNTNAVLFIIYQLLILWEWKQQFLPTLIRRQ